MHHTDVAYLTVVVHHTDVAYFTVAMVQRTWQRSAAPASSHTQHNNITQGKATQHPIRPISTIRSLSADPIRWFHVTDTRAVLPGVCVPGNR
jgi:hypothetical protein